MDSSAPCIGQFVYNPDDPLLDMVDRETGRMNEGERALSEEQVKGIHDQTAAYQGLMAAPIKGYTAGNDYAWNEATKNQQYQNTAAEEQRSAAGENRRQTEFDAAANMRKLQAQRAGMTGEHEAEEDEDGNPLYVKNLTAEEQYKKQQHDLDLQVTRSHLGQIADETAYTKYARVQAAAQNEMNEIATLPDSAAKDARMAAWYKQYGAALSKMPGGPAAPAMPSQTMAQPPSAPTRPSMLNTNFGGPPVAGQMRQPIGGTSGQQGQPIGGPQPISTMPEIQKIAQAPNKVPQAPPAEDIANSMSNQAMAMKSQAERNAAARTQQVKNSQKTAEMLQEDYGSASSTLDSVESRTKQAESLKNHMDSYEASTNLGGTYDPSDAAVLKSEIIKALKSNGMDSTIIQQMDVTNPLESQRLRAVIDSLVDQTTKDNEIDINSLGANDHVQNGRLLHGRVKVLHKQNELLKRRTKGDGAFKLSIPPPAWNHSATTNNPVNQAGGGLFGAPPNTYAGVR